MKIILSFLLVTLSFTAQTQEISKSALGLRIGDNDGVGAEITYQHGMGKKNRIEGTFGWRDAADYNAYKFTGLYQWVWNIDKGFNWYAGAGGGFGGYRIDDNAPGYDETGSFFVLAGDIGIEYLFDFPLQISLDLRPEIYLGQDFQEDDFGPDLALGIRYRF